MRHFLWFSLFLTTIAMAENPEVTFENSNFTINAAIDSDKKNRFYNYNRFRITAYLHKNNWFFTSIGDVENYFSEDIISSNSYLSNRKSEPDTPLKTKTGVSNYGDGEYWAKLYRLYGGYVDANHRISLGLQKVSMGVGRIWNPTDLFNPKNRLALEPDEVHGVASVVYTYSINDLSQITTVVAQQKDHSLKYAVKLKGYVDIVDIAVNIISSDDLNMYGYELEGELLETGIALRSEAGWFEYKLLQEKFFQGIIGADYTFENSLSIATEWLYSSKIFSKEKVLTAKSAMPNNLMQSKSYLGATMGYEFDTLLYGNLFGMINTDDESIYISPSFRYSLDDDMTLQVGAMLYNGKDGSEFGNIGETYYVNIKVTF